MSATLARWRRGLHSAAGIFLVPARRLLRTDLSAFDTPELCAQGLTLVLPGIEGRSPVNVSLVQGLVEGGLPGAVRIVDWTSTAPLSAVYNLCALERNRQQAREVAELVRRQRSEHHGAPVRLIGHSGGAAMSVFALEVLADDAPPLDATILLAAAISPDYDLSRALRGTRRLISYYSPLDFLYLGAGTLLLGTVDRRHSIAAGARGFTTPAGADAALYGERLLQRRFRARMLRSGNLGGHLGWTNRLFAADTLVADLVGGG